MNTYIIAFWSDEKENLKISASRYELDDSLFVFYRGHDKICSIPSGNVLYVWREDA